MSDLPKIVQDRLRAATPRESHPDADVLTAFAEQILSGSERESIVRHLARCGNCREVVALSLPATESVAQPAATGDAFSAHRTAGKSRNWFAWPNLRWAAMAASVVVVGSVLLLRIEKPSSPPAALVTRPAESVSAATDTSVQIAASSDKEPSRSPAARLAKPDTSVMPERHAIGRDEPLLGGAQNQTPPASASQLVDNKRVDSVGRKSNFTFDANKLSERGYAVPSAPPKNDPAASSEVNTSAQEVVVVGGSAGVVETAPAQGQLLARNDAPVSVEKIQKAKPAAKEEAQMKAPVQGSTAQNKFSARAADSTLAGPLQKQRSKSTDKDENAAPQWSLTQGNLRRSLDAGGTWQIALQLQRPLLSFGARGSDVWAGGQAGTLLHSVDGGTTWTMVQPATKAGALGADIIAIEVRSTVEIVLTTTNNEIWTTADAGQTWEKK